MHIKGLADYKKYIIAPEALIGRNPEDPIDEKHLTLCDEGHIGENIINAKTIEDWMDGENDFNSGVFRETDRRIATSLQASAENFNSVTLGQINAIGNPALVPTPYLRFPRDAVNPAQIIYSSRFLPPAATRTINTIGIVNSNSFLVDDPTASTVDTNYTQLVLGVPLTQQDNEVLDISYKILVDWEDPLSNGTINAQIKEEGVLFDAGWLFNTVHNGDVKHCSIGWHPSSSTYSYFPDCTGSNSPTEERRYGFGYEGISLINDPPPFSPTNNNIRYDDVTYGRRGMQFGRSTGDNYLNSDILGHATTGMLVGNSDFHAYNQDNGFYNQADYYGTLKDPNKNQGAPTYTKDWGNFVPWNKTSNISTLWSHNAISTNWMYNVNTLANSSWQPVITENTVVNDFRTAYYLRVVTAGGISVGEYKLYKDNFSNYEDDSITTGPGGGDCLWLLGAWSPYQYFPSDEEVIWSARWVWTWDTSVQGQFDYVSWDTERGVALWRLESDNHSYINSWPNSTAPWTGAFINDVAVYPTGNIIYVATETGLYEITGADGGSPVINQLNADACVSVAVGNSGTAYAVFRDGLGSGRLSTGPTWSAALNTSGLTVNWDNIWRLFIDPDSLTFDLMIWEGPTPRRQLYAQTASSPEVGICQIHWWDTGSTGTTQGVDYTRVSTSNYVLNELDIFPNNRTVSVTNGVWIYPSALENATMVNDTSLSSGRSVSDINYTRARYDVCWQWHLGGYGAIPYWWGYQFDLTQGWRYQQGTNVNTYDIIGHTKTWSFGFHNTAPFHTDTLRGTPVLVTGKPSPGATTYDLLFYTCFNMWNGADANYFTNNNPADAQRVPMKYKLQVDEGGSSTLIDIGSTNVLHDANVTSIERTNVGVHTNIVIGTDNRIFLFTPPGFSQFDYGGPLNDGVEPEPLGRLRYQRYRLDGGISLWSVMKDPRVGGDFDLGFMQAYDWDGVNWVPGTATGPGKPIHLGVEDLIDGLRINWQDLQPGNSQDLIVDQWYNFVKITEAGTILAEPTSPNISGFAEIYYRRLTTSFDSGTIPATPFEITLPEAPGGTAPDPLWLSLPPDSIGSEFSVTVNGLDLPLTVEVGGTPAAGQVFITDPENGIIKFNSADVGQAYTINYFYLQKYDTTETL